MHFTLHWRQEHRLIFRRTIQVWSQERATEDPHSV